MALFNKIAKLISTFSVETISEERKKILQPLVDFIQKKVANKEEIRINFICTHNSRRSLMAQIWAQTLAFHFNLKNIYCYSGGTEATAVFSEVIETMQSSGFEVEAISKGKNPVYSIKYAANEPPIIGFSKEFDIDFNPRSSFAAVMTCSHAEENCPFIAGAEKRVPIPYDDPKLFDNSPQKAEKYSERSRQIATELLYVFAQIEP